MWKNYLKISIRNFARNPLYSFINLFGFTIGIACCLLIMLYVADEISYDRHFRNADHIFRPVSELKFGGRHFHLASGPAPLAEAAINDFPEVVNAGRVRSLGSYMVRREDEVSNIREQNVLVADHELIDIFSLDLVVGDASKALKDPNDLIISQSAAERHFPGEMALGKTLLLDNHLLCRVAGVFRDLPSNTHFTADFFLSMEGHEESKLPSWLAGSNFITYLQLAPGSDYRTLESRLNDFFYKYAGPEIEQFLGSTVDELKETGQGVWYTLQPITEIHLKSKTFDELGVNGDITYVYLFSAIAFFILLIACINFMNLSTAKSTSRAKEVGVRKVLGSRRSQLMNQFLVESTGMSVLAFGLAILLSELAIPYFNLLTGKSLAIPLANPTFLSMVPLAALAVGVMAGMYPALYLSAFRPIAVLKGRLRTTFRTGSFRSSLVVFQFAISILLIVGTIVIYRQLNFIQNKKLGFDREQVVVLSNIWALTSPGDAFKNELRRLPDVKSVSLTSYLPVPSGRSNSAWWPIGRLNDEDVVSMQNWDVDHDYIETLGMEILDGRNFSLDFPSDSSAVILNEVAAEMFGFENPVGEMLSTFVGTDMNSSENFKVIGIVENFHFESLRENISPLLLKLQPSSGYACLKISSDNVDRLIGEVQKIWAEMAPGQPFEYSFLDERFDRLYRSESRTGTIFLIFSVLAIFVACLGLFALSSFSIEKRTKEIGIRKVLGASIRSIYFLLTAEFFKWIFVSCLIALPISYLVARNWLQNYAFQPGLNAMVFATAAGFIVVIAILTISYQVFRASGKNPVQSIRYE